MKTIRIFVLFILTASFLPIAVQAQTPIRADWESYELVNRLLSLPGPGEPLIHENFVIFTAASNLRRVGIAFFHENFANIYSFRPLVVPQDSRNPILLPGEKIPSPFRDSGMQFLVYQIPNHLQELEYRLVINGLWTIDPINPQSRRDPVTGLSLSVLDLPPRPQKPNPLNGLPNGLNFTFKGPPGETVTLAGCFNSWDPFMYEMREFPAGVYNLTLPLPPGTYQYIFFHRGQRYADPYNPRRVYARDGRAASEITVP